MFKDANKLLSTQSDHMFEVTISLSSVRNLLG